jgi:hypothetical protein
MSFDRGGKAAANERECPFIVEVPVAANGLDVELNNQIVGFHKSRRIPPRFGRTIFRDGHSYYRWCFSDLATAHAFVEQFGGRSTKQLALDLSCPPFAAARNQTDPTTLLRLDRRRMLVRTSPLPFKAPRGGARSFLLHRTHPLSACT